MSDGMSGKGGSVMGNANDEGTAIFHNIVNPIRNGDPNGIGAEVVIIDATRGRFPTTARIFEIADELALLAVDADDGQMTALETVAQLGQIFELKISVGTGTGGDLLLIDPQRIAHVMEQAGDGIGGDGNAEFSQLIRDGGSSTARPA
jgi:UDP-N-acetylmuramyl tripeptide synthase